MKLETAIAPTHSLRCTSGLRQGAPSIFAKSRAGALVQMKSRLRSKPLRSTRSTFVAPPAMAEGCCLSWERHGFRWRSAMISRAWLPPWARVRRASLLETERTPPMCSKVRPLSEGACQSGASGPRRLALQLRHDVAGCGGGRIPWLPAAWERWPCRPSPNGKRA
jgi:hypothetical protein